MTSTTATAGARASGAGIVLFTLAAGQFLMTLDTSVMNVSIATVAEDVGTTVTGIQGAITAYTLVMASLMITGAKIGAMIGRKRAFAIGCIIYGAGSFTTSISPSLPVLLASAFSAVYPCHVPQQVMRTKPVGTGPFKFVEFKRGDTIRLVRNPDYFKKDRPYLD